MTVTVNPLPPVSITPTSATICIGGSATLTASGAATYGWSPPTGLDTTTGPTVHASPTNTTSYTVTGTDTNGCQNTASVTVTVNPPPACSIMGASSVCALSLSNSYSATAGMSSYNWEISGNGAITGASNAQTVAVNAGASNTFILAVSIADSNGCSSSCTNVVAINALPSATITAPSAVCANSANNSASVPSPLTTLHNFGGGGADGASPWGAALMKGTDGYYYGTTDGGGSNNMGTVFRINSAGTLTTLYSFSGPDGSQPEAGLVRDSNGNFYGTTAFGGAHDDGTVFKLGPDGSLTTLHSFSRDVDGASPVAALMLGRDGYFYGTTQRGGTNVGVPCLGSILPVRWSRCIIWAPWLRAQHLETLRLHGLSDRDILDAVQVIAYFNYINRVADALGIDPEPEMQKAHEQWQSPGQG